MRDERKAKGVEGMEIDKLVHEPDRLKNMA